MYELPKLIEHEINYRIPEFKKYLPENNHTVNKFRHELYGFEKPVKTLCNSVIHDLRFRASALKKLSEPFSKFNHIFPVKR